MALTVKTGIRIEKELLVLFLHLRTLIGWMGEKVDEESWSSDFAKTLSCISAGPLLPLSFVKKWSGLELQCMCVV